MSDNDGKPTPETAPHGTYVRLVQEVNGQLVLTGGRCKCGQTFPVTPQGLADEHDAVGAAHGQHVWQEMELQWTRQHSSSITTPMTIDAFLLARIEEDEAVALAAIDDDCGSTEGFAGQYERLVQPPSGVGYAQGGFGGPAARMIVTFAVPARVLAECAAKRAIIEAQHWEPQSRPSDSELHSRASHPAYEYATTEGPRKQWDDADEPPEGEGWERNIDSGRDGWARFDYTEESYWRRLKPEAERREWQQYIPAALRALAAVYSAHPDYRQGWAL